MSLRYSVYFFPHFTSGYTQGQYCELDNVEHTNPQHGIQFSVSVLFPQAHMEAVHADWKEYLNLLICEENHLKHMDEYHKVC